MNKAITPIICAYSFHVISIVLTATLVGDYGDALLIISGILNIMLIVIWTVINIKREVPWMVYVHFVIGTAAEIFLNAGGVIGGRTGLDLAQFFYICEIIAVTLILGVIRSVICFIRIKRSD